MMKAFRIVIVTLILLFMLVIPAAAVDVSEFFDGQLEASGADSLIGNLPDEAKELLEDIGITDINYKEMLDTSPRKIIDMLLNILLGRSQNPLRAGLRILGVILLFAIADSFDTATDKNKSVINIVSALFVVSVIIVPFSDCISNAGSAIKASSDFMLLLIPILAAIIAVGGNPTLAFSYNSLVFAVAQAIAQIAENFLAPMTGIFTALAISTSVSPMLGKLKLTDLIHKVVVTTLSFGATIFIGLLTTKGLLASAADTVAIKGAKFVVSSLIPVVGGALSDAYSSILGCLSLVKGAVGIFGIAAVAAINLPIIIEICLWMLALNLCAACSEMLGQENITSLLRGICTAVNLLCAILIFNTFLLIVSTAVMLAIKGGG